MTVLTERTQTFLMGVLTLVTGIAIGRRLLLVEFTGVAAEARRQAVFPG